MRSLLPWVAPLVSIALAGACGRFDGETGAPPDGGTGAVGEAGPADGPAVVDDAGAAKDSSTEDAPADAFVSNDATPLRTYRYIWVLPLPTRAALSSIAAGDSLCGANLPPGLGVTKAKALLVGSTRRACQSGGCSTGAAEHVDWPLGAATEYRRTDGLVVGTTNEKGIFAGGVSASIGNSNTVYAFTGLANGNTWMTGDTCNDWSSTAATDFGQAGYTGPTYVAPGQPFGAFVWECNQTAAIYCVETP